MNSFVKRLAYIILLAFIFIAWNVQEKNEVGSIELNGDSKPAFSDKTGELNIDATKGKENEITPSKTTVDGLMRLPLSR